MKSDALQTGEELLTLVECILTDVSALCSATVSVTRDRLTMRSRVEREGASFLTIALPMFARDFEKSLEQGFVDEKRFLGYKRRGGGKLPCFLQGLTSRLFDNETGRLLDDSPESSIYVEAVRQVCLFAKKVELPCTPERECSAVSEYVKIEQELVEFSAPEGDVDSFRAVCDALWGRVLERPFGFNTRRASLDTHVPRHGPGAVAERTFGNAKWSLRRWHERLEPFFPFFGVGYPTSAAARPRYQDLVTFVPEDQEQPVRVVLVPKTLKSPRVIAVEPTCMQFVQQGLKRLLYELLESHPLTRRRVNFKDQSLNQRAALAASVSGQSATIDLSEASDRVPLDLAMMMFDTHPDLKDAILACRSTRAQLPDGRIVPLRKFASMGSALCFPVEAMYFYSLAVKAVLEAENLPLTRKGLQKASIGILVYGDDLIVPARHAEAVLGHLQQYNCKVNWNKTFTAGKFRESCGLDAYSGERVTPVYLRTLRPQSRRQVSEVLSWVSTGNQLALKGYETTSEYMLSSVERVVGRLPQVRENADEIGRVVPEYFTLVKDSSTDYRWNTHLHRLERRGLVPVPVGRSDGINGYPALHKSLTRLEAGLKPGQEADEAAEWDYPAPFGVPKVVPSSVSNHPRGWLWMEKSVPRGAVTLKRRWVAVPQ